MFRTLSICQTCQTILWEILRKDVSAQRMCGLYLLFYEDDEEFCCSSGFLIISVVIFEDCCGENLSYKFSFTALHLSLHWILGRTCLVCNMTSLWASGNSAPVNKQESFKRNIISISTGFSFQSSIKSQFVKFSILIQIASFQCVKNIKSLLLCQTQHQRLHEHVVLFIRHPSA